DVRIAHRDRLCDLDLELWRREVGLANGRDDIPDEQRVFDFRPRAIYGEHEVRAGPDQAPDFGERAPEHEAVDLHDEADLFRDLDEALRRNVALLRVMPARQRLHPQDAAIHAGHLGLVMDDELFIADRQGEVGFERMAGPGDLCEI